MGIVLLFTVVNSLGVYLRYNSSPALIWHCGGTQEVIDLLIILATTSPGVPCYYTYVEKPVGSVEVLDLR